MNKEKVKEIIRKRSVKIGGVVLAAALVFTGGVMTWRNAQQTVPELVSFVDSEGSVAIDEEETPLGVPKVTKSTKTQTKKKKIKLKKASKKTYVQKGKSSTKSNTKTSRSGNTTTTTVTVTAKDVKNQFKKGSKIKTQITTVKTTITKSVLTASPGTSAEAAEEATAVAAKTTAAAATGTATASTAGEVAIGTLVARADSRAVNAFTKMGFKVVTNPGVNYSGLFDARSRTITLKVANETAYHELGHFVGFVAGNYDRSAAFQAIFNSEKSKYTFFNKAYVLTDSSEYFAESFKNYTLNPTELKTNRPQTYAAIETALSKITDSQVTTIMNAYKAIWG